MLLSWILKRHLVVTIKRANAFPIGDPILPRTGMIRRRVFDGYPPLSSRPRVAGSPSRYTTTSHPSLFDPLFSLDLFALQFLILPQKIIQKWICSDVILKNTVHTKMDNNHKLMRKCWFRFTHRNTSKPLFSKRDYSGRFLKYEIFLVFQRKSCLF